MFVLRSIFPGCCVGTQRILILAVSVIIDGGERRIRFIEDRGGGAGHSTIRPSLSWIRALAGSGL